METKNKQSGLIGDSKYAQGYNIPLIHQEDAQGMIEILLEEMGYSSFRDILKVKYTYKLTMHRYGYFDRAKMTIFINTKGMTEGTLIHELTHFWCSGHGKNFKSMQDQLIKLWYGNNS